MSDAHDAAPRTLRERAEPGPASAPIAGGAEVSALHVAWALLHARGGGVAGVTDEEVGEETGAEVGEPSPDGRAAPGVDSAPDSGSRGRPRGGRARAKARARFVSAVRPIAAEEAAQAAGRVEVRVGGVEAAERASAAAQEDLYIREGQDRGLIGNLIRVVDLLAARVDEVAARVEGLERLVQDLVDVTSEDLARVHAELSARMRDDP